jgi:hypothetical protein
VLGRPSNVDDAESARVGADVEVGVLADDRDAVGERGGGGPGVADVHPLARLGDAQPELGPRIGDGRVDRQGVRSATVCRVVSRRDRTDRSEAARTPARSSA